LDKNFHPWDIDDRYYIKKWDDEWSKKLAHIGGIVE
jgi:hypothetical protein